MWSLVTYQPLGKPPSSIQVARDPLEDLRCQSGSIDLVSVSGSLLANSFGIDNLNVWVMIGLTSESVSGHNPQSASWTNGQITIAAP
jgi:hypothetical protein